MRHLDIGVELVDLVYDGVLVIVTKVVIGLLLAQDSVNIGSVSVMMDMPWALGPSLPLRVAARVKLNPD